MDSLTPAELVEKMRREQRCESIKAALRRNELMDLICRADRNEYPSELLVECLHEVEWEKTRRCIGWCVVAVLAAAAWAILAALIARVIYGY